MEKKKTNVVALNGGAYKENTETENNLAKVTVDDQTIELSSLVLSGVNKDGKRCVLTWNCSLDEISGHLVVLDTVVRDKIRETIYE